VFVGTTPCGPSSSTTPTLSGTAEASGTVKIYTTVDCSGSPVATVAADSSGDWSKQLTVSQGTTTTWYATTTDAASNTSSCSTGLEYEARTCDTTPPGYDKVWTGTNGTSWSDAGNWSPSGVPSSSNDVFICSDPANQPVLSGDVSVGDLLVQGATVDTNGHDLTVTGDLIGNGITGSGEVKLSGANASLKGCGLPVLRIENNIVLAGRTTTTGDLIIPAGKRLTIGSQRLEIGRDLQVTINNVPMSGLRMITAGGEVIVTRNASFWSEGYAGSATTLGNFTAGTIRFRGNFSQTVGFQAGYGSFISTGTKVVLDGSGAQSVYFEYPGETRSRFEEVEVGSSSSVTATMGSWGEAIWVTGDMTVTGGSWTTSEPMDFGGDITVSGGSLTTGGADVDDNVSVSSSGALGLGGNCSVGGTVDVTGASAFSFGNCSITGAITASGSSTLNGTGGTWSSNLTLTGASLTASGTVNLEGDVAVSSGGSLSVGTNSTADGAVSVTGSGSSLGIDTCTFAGQVSVSSSASMTGNTGYFTTALPLLDSATYTVTDTYAQGNVSLSQDITLPATTNLRVYPGYTLNINGHTLDHGGDFYMKISNTPSSGLRLVDASSVLIVRGDADFWTKDREGSATTDGSLTAGEIHFKGDFSQWADFQGSRRTFVATGTKCIFDGTSAQTISFGDPDLSFSHFHGIDFLNTAGVTISSDFFATGPVTVGSGVTAATTGDSSAGSVSVDGGTLTIGSAMSVTGSVSADNGGGIAFGNVSTIGGGITLEGASTFSFGGGATVAGAVQVEGGSTLTATGSPHFNGTVTVDAATLDCQSASWMAQTLTVTNGASADLTGDAELSGAVDVLAASTLDIGTQATFEGLVQVQGGSTMTGTNALFTTRLPEIDSSTYTVTYTKPSGTASMVGSLTLPSATTLYIEEGGSLNLNGNTLTLEGNLFSQFTNTANSGLRLVDSGSVLYVNGDATFSSKRDHFSNTTEGSFTAGEIHFRGDFTQEKNFSCSANAFISTGTKTIFDGSSAQTVYFAWTSASNSRFHDVEIGNSAGVTFTNDSYATGDLDLSGTMTVNGSEPFGLTGTMTLRSTGVLNSNGQISVGGCVKEQGHTINGSDPCP